jgi:hypothetical protein
MFTGWMKLLVGGALVADSQRKREMKKMCLAVLVLTAASLAIGQGMDMRFTTALHRSGVEAPGYTLDLQHDLSTPETTVSFSPGWDVDWSISAFSLVENGTRYSFDFLQDPPDFYPIATGPLFNELHLVNIVLRDDGGTAWPGLAVLSFYAFDERLYVKVRFVTHSDDSYIIHNDDGIASDNFVYEPRSGFGSFAGSTTVTAVDFELECSKEFQALETPATNSVALPSGRIGFVSTTPGTDGVFSTGASNTNRLVLSYAFSESWGPDEDHEFGFMVAPGEDDRAIAALLRQYENLAALSLDTSGQTHHFSPMRGLWEMVSPLYAGSSKGVIKSTEISVSNPASDPVEVVLDARNSWGGISGSYARDAAGEPQHMLPQHYINYPENAAQGESGGARIYNRFMVPAGGSFDYTFQTLYRGGATNAAGFHYDWMQRDTLGHRPNLQPISHYTINRQESLTLRHDPLNVTDWRKHPDNLTDEYDVANSASAGRTEFFQVQLASGDELYLISTDVAVSQAGPFFVEETHAVESVPEGIEGTIRFWSAAWMDEAYGTNVWGEGNSRWGAEVDLTATQSIAVDSGATHAVSMLSFYRSNPGYFKKFGYSSNNSGTEVVSIASEVHIEAEPLPAPFFAGFFSADNNIGRTSASTGETILIPYSDVTGNPFLAVWDWGVEMNGSAVPPTVSMDAIPPSGGVERNWYIVPASVPSSISAGSRIAFKLMAATGGDSSSDESYGETHFNAWKDLNVTASVGAVLSVFPPRVKADSTGRAEFTVTGGTEWIPVTVVGVNPDVTQLVVESGSSATNLIAMAAPVDGEPWVQVQVDDATGLTSVSLPVRSSDTAQPRSRFVRVTSGSGAEDADADGIGNAVEGPGDADKDGIANYVDTDADGNSVGDSVEGTVDTDNDGIADYLDPDNDGDLGVDQLEKLAGGFINDGYYAHGFDLEGSRGSWEPNIKHLGRPVISNGMFSAAVTGNDSMLILKGLGFSGDDVQTVLVRMRLSQGSAGCQLFWANEDGGFSAARSTSVSLGPAGQFNEYVFDLSGNSNWVGKTITSLRLDPVGSTGIGGTLELDWIFLSPGDLDGDQTSDGYEILAGTGFSDAADRLWLAVSGIATAQTNAAIHGQFSAKQSRQYQVLRKDDLTGTNLWEEVLLLGPYASDQDVVVLLEETAAPQSFYRINPL